jgi:hypothetical protein
MSRRFAGAGLGRRPARSSVGASAPATPATILGASLYTWLNPAVGITNDPPVSVWASAAGSESVVATFSGDGRPSYANTLDGLPVLTFDGDFGSDTTLTAIGGANGDVTVAFAFKLDAGTANGDIVFFLRTAADAARIRVVRRATALEIGISDSAGALELVYCGGLDVGWHTVVIRHWAAGNSVLVDDAEYANQPASTRTSSSAVLTKLYFCNTGAGGSAECKFADVIIASGTITESQSLALRDWFRSKYTSLPNLDYDWGFLSGQSNARFAQETMWDCSGYGEYVQIASHAKDSTDLAIDWAPASALRVELLARIAAMPRSGVGGVKGAFIWWQGEKDASDETKSNAYGANLEALAEDVRTAAGDANLPIILVLLSTASDRPFKAIVRAAEESFAAADVNCFTVNIDAYAMTDGAHVDAGAPREAASAAILVQHLLARA